MTNLSRFKVHCRTFFINFNQLSVPKSNTSQHMGLNFNKLVITYLFIRFMFQLKYEIMNNIKYSNLPNLFLECRVRITPKAVP